MAKRKKQVFAISRQSDGQFLGTQEAVSTKIACVCFSRRGGHGSIDPFISKLTARPATKEQIRLVCPICRYSQPSHTQKMREQCKRTRLERIRTCAFVRFARANPKMVAGSP